MRKDPAWIDRVVDNAEGAGLHNNRRRRHGSGDHGPRPAHRNPAGPLSWYEILALLRATISKREVVACDVVELSPLPGLMAPNFLCAKLVYKILTYRFAGR
jgi:hypothetical protein